MESYIEKITTTAEWTCDLTQMFSESVSFELRVHVVGFGYFWTELGISICFQPCAFQLC